MKLAVSLIGREAPSTPLARIVVDITTERVNRLKLSTIKKGFPHLKYTLRFGGIKSSSVSR